MKKIAITQELISLANELDNLQLFKEANTLTKIAHIVVAEDYKHDPMVYNPDEKDADVQEAHSMDYLDAMEALNKLVESGELNPRELSQIQAILSDSDEGPDPFKEMSFDEGDDDMEHSLGLGAVPHTRIKNKSDYDDYDFDDDDDDDISLSDDDEDPELNDPFAWQYLPDEDDDMRNRNHQENLDGDHYFMFDEDDRK